MKRAQNNFDFIAKVYEHLARMIFGNELIKAQCHLLTKIPPNARVLILGGGTGEILDKLVQQNPGCRIWYIDASIEMLEAAKKRASVTENVLFIHGTQDAIPEGQQFDAVITNFYLDLFNGDSLTRVIQTIVLHLRD